MATRRTIRRWRCKAAATRSSSRLASRDGRRSIKSAGFAGAFSLTAGCRRRSARQYLTSPRLTWLDLTWLDLTWLDPTSPDRAWPHRIWRRLRVVALHPAAQPAAAAQFAA